MKIEDIRKLAEEKNIPKHLIDELLTKIKLDEEGNVIDNEGNIFDYKDIYLAMTEIERSANIVRANLESLQYLKEKMKRKRAGK